MSFKYANRSPALALALALALSGCGDKEEKDTEEKATQVIAKVNSDEITVHQLNHELGKLGNVSPEQAKAASKQAVKALVDQELLLQKAIEDKVDRDPKVVQAIDANRRQLLVQAYAQRLTANAVKPTDSEITDYYNKNPALFSERRIFRLQEVSIQTTAENLPAVKAKLAAAANLNEFAAWLKENKIPARGGQSTKAAEQLPLELLPRLHAMKDGQAVTMQTAGGLNIIFLAGSQKQPIALDKSKPVIEQYLMNAKKREIAEAELKRLREAGKVEYMGEYADLGKEVAAPAAQPAPAQTAPATPAAAPAQPAAPADQNAMERGLQGL